MDVGTEEGDVCARDGCEGVIEVTREGEGCSCHIWPPCGYCVSAAHSCPACEWAEWNDA